MSFGTLKFDTLKTSDAKKTNTEKSIDTSYLFNGATKSWVQFDGTATNATARDSFNVTNMTDHSTGTYSVNFTSNMANDDYAFAMAGSNTTTGQPISTGDSGHQTVVAVGSLKFSLVGTSSNSVTDCNIGSAIIIGDLA